jgi:hypothetical protein
MATIPLVALDTKTQGPSPLDVYGKAQGILGQQQEQQVRGLQIQQAQLSLQDQQAQTKAMQAWDGKDYNDIPTLIKQNGGSLNAVIDASQKIVARQQAMAKLTGDQLDNAQKQGDQYRGRIQAVINAPNDQKQSLWDAEITREEQAGTVKPGAMTHQYPGDDAATYLANHFALGSTLAKEASENTAAQARKSTADTAAGKFAAEQNPQSPLFAPTPAATNIAAQSGAPWATSAQAGAAKQAGAVAGAEAAAKQPFQMQLEQIRQSVAKQTGISKDAQDKIESTVLKPYEDKMSQITELNSALDQASQGNVTAARGVLLKLIGVTNPDGTKRYNAAEADRLLQQGSIPQRVAGTVKNILTGDNWTGGMMADMKSFAAGQGQSAAVNLNRGIDNVNKLYGTSVGGGLKQPTSVKMRAPNGQISDVNFADVDHYKKMGATVVPQ